MKGTKQRRKRWRWKRKGGYFKTYSALHQELGKNALKQNSVFPINKRRRITYENVSSCGETGGGGEKHRERKLHRHQQLIINLNKMYIFYLEHSWTASYRGNDSFGALIFLGGGCDEYKVEEIRLCLCVCVSDGGNSRTKNTNGDSFDAMEIITPYWCS